MKKIESCVLIIMAMLIFTSWNGSVYAQTNTQQAAGSVPFSRGINFNYWFEVPNAESIIFSMYDEQDFVGVKAMGMDVIRLSININAMTSGLPNHTINPLLLRYLDQVIDWAEKHQLYIILCNHPLSMPPTPNNIDRILIPVWKQIAQHFKDRSDYVLYEILNEPHTISTRRWGTIQGNVIREIRRIDQRHTIIVSGIQSWVSSDLSSLPRYSDRNLIYTFHFYEPILFTFASDHFLSGVPWPYNRNRMPPNSGRTRDDNNLLNNYINYEREASPEIILKKIDEYVKFSRQRNVPIFCGEFGSEIINHNEDRVRWQQFIANAFNERNIPWTSHSYYGFFGIFKPEYSGKNINTELNIELVKAMGFTPPPQTQQVPAAPRSGFTVYDGNFTNDFFIGGFTYHIGRQPLIVNLNGTHAIHWENVPLYQNLTIIFKRITDLSNLVTAGYILEFKVRADKPVSFDVRFLNPENANSIPWQMVYVVNESMIPPDGRWHTIRIPLRDMQDYGAWDNAAQQFINSRRAFSWRQIRSLEFAPNYSGLTGGNVWFDSIRIVAP